MPLAKLSLASNAALNASATVMPVKLILVHRNRVRGNGRWGRGDHFFRKLVVAVHNAGKPMKPAEMDAQRRPVGGPLTALNAGQKCATN